MNREIKFRGKCVLTKNWVFGFYVEYPDDGGVLNFITYKDVDFEVYEDSIGQFTGLHDMDGKEIYEGDVLRLHESDITGVVYWNESCAGFKVSTKMGGKYETIEEWEMYTIEIVGNIFDNPELA